VTAVKLYSDRAWWLPAVFAVFGGCVAVAGVVVVAGELRGVSIHGPAMAGGVIATVFGGLFGYFGAAGMREGGTYVLIDPAARTLRYQRGRKSETFSLAQLGALDVVQQHETPGRRGPELVIYELRAERVPWPLFRSARRDLVEQRKARVASMTATFEK
jgi:hypothetical protein